jgi:hypothetical protein
MRAALWVLALPVATATVVLAARPQDEFPHQRHARLFPVCAGCHAGIPTGEVAEYYPPPAACTNCHDGQREERVQWAGPSPRMSNLRFRHDAHADSIAAAGEEQLDCGTCHTEPGAGRMEVRSPIPARCFGCHAHAATEHFADAACTTCHVPLVEARLDSARIAELPRPAAHERDDFLATGHGELAVASPATCATCHAREQCSGCHVAFSGTVPVDRIPTAAGRHDIPLIAARYPVPASHRDPEWERIHGSVATRGECATCHTRDSCAACHAGTLPRVAADLPRAADVTAPGARVERSMPASHASVSFATLHGPVAGARPESCTSCHEPGRFCAACHQTRAATAPGGGAPLSTSAREPDSTTATAQRDRTAAGTRTRQERASGRGFHPANFSMRHASLAYGQRLECGTCHNTQLFCRDCHAGLGMRSAGRLGSGYHDAEPVWLLRHGQAARQTLGTCTSCHTQRDCMQCHSQFGSFRISPHGPSFDARRAQRVNPQICRACHIGDPFSGG